MTTVVELKSLLPDFYDDLYEAEILMQAEQKIINQLADCIDKTQSNAFISTADSDTISVYENMLRIAPLEDDTIEQRRFRVLTNLTNQQPYTQAYLIELLNSLGSVSTFNFVGSQLVVSTNFEKQGQLTEVLTLLRKIVPANLTIRIDNIINAEFSLLPNYTASALSTLETIEIRSEKIGI